MHLCSKQAAFLSIMKEMTFYEIVSFDCSFVDKNIKEGTMQDGLMWLLSTKNEGRQDRKPGTNKLRGLDQSFAR